MDATVTSRDAQRAASNGELVAAIRAEIGDDAITFERFMELALYHPEYGYYVGRSDRPTRTGDYLTAPETHHLFGHTLSRQLTEMWRVLGEPAEFTLREYGAGTGSLALSVLEGLRADGSPLADALRYEPIEIGRGRADSVLGRVNEAGFGSALRGVGALRDDSSLRDNGSSSDLGKPLVGCIVANELLDALPVHRVVMRGGQLYEVFVTWRDGWFADEPREPSTDALATYLDAAGVALADGQEAEVNLRAPDWIRSAAAELQRGYLLLIDYGHDAAELYGPKRFRGTLLGYRGHAVSDDPYAAVGEQDLTSHVDLSAVESAAQAAGLQIVGRTTQAEFLAALGLGELLDRLGRTAGTDPAEYIAARAATLRLIDPRAMGAFAVLAFGRDVPDTALTGFSMHLQRR